MKTMQIITLVNEKGGVGKTTCAAHIAAGLAISGARVVLVDADPQGHATLSLGLNKQPCFYDLLVRDANFENSLRVPELSRYAIPGDQVRGALYVLPGNIETRAITENVGDDLWLFAERFSELEGQIDVVIVDTSPTPSLLHGLIYMATDHLIYPTELEDLSLDGLAESIKHKTKANANRTAKGLNAIQVMGIQPTMYRVTNGHDYHLQQLMKAFKQQVWPSIPQRTIWVERAAARKTLYAYAPDDQATMEAWAMVDRVQKGLMSA